MDDTHGGSRHRRGWLHRQSRRPAAPGRRPRGWVYDNLSLGHRAAVPAERLIVGDLMESPRLDHALVTGRIEAVIHFAAFASSANR